MKLSTFSWKLYGVFIFSLFTLNIYTQSSIDKTDQQFDQARFIFHTTYFEKASILFDSILSQQKDHALSYGYAAVIDYMLFRDPSEKINRAIALSKENDPNHLFTLALCSFAMGDLPDCESKMTQYLSYHPNNKYGLHVLGFTQIDLGRFQEGLNTLNDLINKEPLFTPAYNHIGYSYLKLEQNENALNSFAQFLEADTLNPSALDSYAEGLAALGEYDKAIASLTKAILLEPDFAYGWMHMGDIFILNGEHELAKRAYSTAKNLKSSYGVFFDQTIDKKIRNLNEK